LNKPIVSIAVITYNQAEFVSETLESILNQEFNFDYEILISDDASTDETVNILKSFKAKHPSKINLILHKKNLGPTKNLYELILKCEGKYIAILEGDDFWTTNNKLKQQIEFLDANKSHIACTHRYSVVDQNSKTISEEYYGPGKPEIGEYSIRNFENYTYYGLLGSLMFRNIFIKHPSKLDIVKDAHPFIADITLNLLLVLNGAIFVMENNMSAHRIIIERNGTNYKSTIRGKSQVKNRVIFLEILEKFAWNNYKVKIKHTPRNEDLFVQSCMYLFRYPSKHNFNNFLFVFKLIESRSALFKYFFKRMYKIPSFLFKYLSKALKN